MKHYAIATFTLAAALAGGAAQAQGWGPGMMGGYGPGMMGGGYGPGMMGGYGPGMMGGYGYGYGALPDLTAEQRSKIVEIQREARAKQWPLMQQMQELMWSDSAYDEQGQRRDYDKMAALQKQMFENGIDTRKRIEAVLTPQQREQLRRGGPGRG